MEVHFFGLVDTSTGFTAASAGAPLLARPFFNALVNAQDTLIVASGAVGPGQVTASEKSRLLGVGAAYDRLVCTTCWGGPVIGILGYRYLKLSDDFLISSNTNSLIPPFVGAVSFSDQFNTRNHFHGVDLGLTGVVPYGAWRFDWMTKVALGVTSTDLNIDGATAFTPAGGATTVLTGGLLAQTTNIGQHSDSRFSTVSEINARLGYQFSRQWRAYAGYNLLYWTGVVRPGGAIDTVVNPNLIPPAVGGGTARPAVQFNSTDYWAHGVNFGMAANF